MANKRNITASLENRTLVIHLANLLIGLSWMILRIRDEFRVIKPAKCHMY